MCFVSISVDGEKWYSHRKTSSNLFNTNKFKGAVLDTFNRHVDILLQILQQHTSAGAGAGSDGGQPVDIQV